MLHRFRSTFVALVHALFVCAILCWSAAPARGQNLAFNPGLASTYAGDPTQSHTTSSATYNALPLNNWSNEYTKGSGLVLNFPTAVALDSNGNMYVADRSGALRVLASGKGAIPAAPGAGSNPQGGYVYQVAGNGMQAVSGSCTYPGTATNKYGDGCAATNAPINIAAIAVDANGNIFLADGSAIEIRVIYSSGSVPGLPSTPVAGNIYAVAGTAGTYGQTGDGGPALSAELGNPNGVAVDSNENIYISDSGDDAIRVVYAGKGNVPGLPSSPTAGNLYTIAGTLGTGCSYANGTCGDDGPATSAEFCTYLGGITVDSSGNIYIADQNNARVRAIYAGGTLPGISSPTAGYIYTVAGGGTSQTVSGQATNVQLQQPAFVATDPGGALYFTDDETHLAYRVDASGAISVVFGGAQPNVAGSSYVFCSTSMVYGSTTSPVDIGDGCPANDTVVDPTGITLDSAGNIYIADEQKGLIREATVTLTFMPFNGTFGLTVPTQILSVSNTGTKTLQLSGINVPQPFTQVATGGSTDCDGSTALAPGTSCQIGVTVAATEAGPFNGMLQVGSNSTNASGGVNTVSLSANIALAASSTTLTASPAAPAQVGPGQPVTFTATVLPQTGVSTIPTGTVSFNSGGTVIGTGTLNSSGVATLTTSSNLVAGLNVVTAAYSGDSNFGSSNSNAAFVAVASVAVPTVALSVSPSSSVTAGQSVTLTATVTPPSGGASPTGTIIFQEGTAPISSAISLSNGSGTFSTTSLPVGVNTLIAVYSGNLGANDSSPVVLTVGANAQLQFTPGVIAAVAGDYNDSYGTDTGIDGPGTSAALGTPAGVAYDSAGNLYFADGAAKEVLVVASGKGTIPGVANPVAGDMYIVAGTGATCSTLPCGDGGQATAATLNLSFFEAGGVAVDLAGNLYIADGGDGAIRKVTPAGIISTVAGTLGSPAGQSTGDGGPATNATLTSSLNAIAVDLAGNLYFADTNVVRRVDAQTQIITTVAGSQAAGGTYSGDGGPANAAGLSEPAGIALDSQGDLYIADTNNQVVREVNAQTGIISTVAGQDYNPSSLFCQYGALPCFTGDGGPATQATLYTPSGIGVDGAGNLYIYDSGNTVVRAVSAQTGMINTIAGQGGQNCPSFSNSQTCGDGGLATSAWLNTGYGLTMDSAGDFVLADTFDSTVRQITAATDTLNFGSPNLGSTVDQPVTVTNTGSQPLNLTGITFPDGFTQAASGGTDCTSSTTLAPAGQCIIDVQFFPTEAQAYPGTITVASNSSNAQNGSNAITVSGTGEGFGGTTAQTITFPQLPAKFTYGAAPFQLNASAPGGTITYQVTGPATVSGSTLTITGGGNVTVTAYQFGNATYAEAAAVSQSFVVSPATLTVAAAQNMSLKVGTPLPAPTYAITGFAGSDTQATTTTGAPTLTVVDSSGNTYAVGSTPLAGTYTIQISQGTLALTGAAATNYTLAFSNGQLTVTGSTPQTIISFGQLSNVTYGVQPITLQATASSGLQVSYLVQGPAKVVGDILTVTGAGSVAVTATQAGNSQYAAVQNPPTQSFQVLQAPLNVEANNVSVAQGAPIPTLTYTITGFVNGDTQAVVTGIPTLTTTATSSSPIGQYPITVAMGTLTAANYTFNLVSSGAVNIVAGQSQTITFPAPPNVTYGAAPFALSASASSGLAVTYKVVSGHATVAGNMLTVTGAGTVTVQASQSGNTTYAPANTTQSFNVGPALLMVVATNVTRVNNVQNPPLTSYSITGFVNNDTQAVVSGTPALSTTALPGSPVGTYPIVITQQPTDSAQNPITAANYVFTFVNGTLTITPGGPTPDYSLSANPALLTIPQGQLRQTIITLTPTNYFQGTVNLSCGNLPANITCIFSPSALIADGTGTPVTVALTVNTNGASTVLAQGPSPSAPHAFPSAAFWMPGELAALVMALSRRKRMKNTRMFHLLVLLILFTGAVALTACGGSSSASGSQYAATGNYTVSIGAAGSVGGPSHSMNLTVDVQ